MSGNILHKPRARDIRFGLGYDFEKRLRGPGLLFGTGRNGIGQQ